MDNQNTTITLDDRIRKDLEDLYNSGILKFIEQFKNCKIKEAEELSKNLFDTPNELSSHGLPGYYTGKRDAKTVMVMLNPGSDVISHNNPFVTEKALERTMKELGITNPSSSADFLNLFVKGSNNYGDIDKDDKEDLREVKRNVLMEKLQLELIPYASREFKKMYSTVHICYF